MKYKTLKCGGEYDWEGNSPEFEWRDGVLYSITFFDKNGLEMKITLDDLRSLQVLIPDDSIDLDDDDAYAPF